MFVATFGQAHRILTVSPDETVATLAGSAEHGEADGRGEAARFHSTKDMAEGPDGQLYVAEFGGDKIRRIDREGNVSAVAGRRWQAGETQESIDGDIAVARFQGPSAIAVASDGTIYVGEQAGRRVRQIREGVVSTLCQCEGLVRGMLLDEPSGLLYLTAGDRILTIVVPSLMHHLVVRFAPILRLASLVRRERAELIAAVEPESAQPGDA